MAAGDMIFISYRRADAGGHAGRLFDRLRQWFDGDSLFYDLDGIDIGDTFPARIESALDSAAVVLVLIGPDWLAEINRRVGQPGVDFVRREVELALARHAAGVPVLPVLLGGASMPSADQFHTDLQTALSPLCALDAHKFEGKQADWDAQFVRLRERIAKVPGIPAPRFRVPAGVEQPFRVIERDLTHFRDPNRLLERLHEQLTSSGSAAVLARAALYGMGGVGKTQLALKYSHEYRDLYAGVWWFRAEAETTLQLDAKDCCDIVSAPIGDGELPAAALKRWLERQDTTWLLVFDNAENVDALRPCLPQGGAQHLIITSRNPAWGGVAKPLELETWTPEQGADFLGARLPSAAHNELLQLAHQLGGLPLALEQAASYIETTGTSVADYRALLAGTDTEGLILDEGRAATGYERSVATTLSLAFDRLSTAAARLLHLLAFAAPEPFPERFFREASEHLPAELAAAAAHPLTWNRVAGELRRFGIADRKNMPALDRQPGEADNRTEPALSLHRLTQQVVRAKFAAPKQDVPVLMDVLYRNCPSDTSLPENWPCVAALNPHILGLHRYYDCDWLDRGRISWLLDHVAGYLRDGPALFADARAIQEGVLAVRRRLQGEEHPDTLNCIGNLAATLLTQDDLVGARALQEQVLAVRRRAQGEEHPDVLTSINNLAVTLRRLGDLSGACVLFEKVLEVRQRTQGLDHPDTLTCKINLANTLRKQGELARARALEEDVIDVSRRKLGDEHPHTLTAIAHYSSTLSDAGDLVGARALQENVLEVRRRVLGEEHPDTLISMNNLALTLKSQGDLAGARALQEIVLEVRRRLLGNKHSDTLGAMNNLALTLRDMGDVRGARALQEEVVLACRKKLGDEHPNTLASRSNLAVTLRMQGHLAEARKIHEEVLGVRRKTLREDHPDTLTSMASLSTAAFQMGDRSLAIEWMQSVANVRERLLGPNHPDTVSAREDANWMRSQAH